MNTQQTTDEQPEADRLDRAYQAWLSGASAPPDDELDAPLHKTAQRVAQELTAPGPSAEFAAELKGRLQAVALPAAPAAARSQPQGRRFAFGAHPLRIAAALVLASLLGVYLLSLRPEPVSAQEIVRRAQTTLASPAAAGIQSYFLAEQSTAWAGRQTAGADTAPVAWRGAVRRWFQAPDRWRMEAENRPYAADGQLLEQGGWNTTIVSDGSSQYDYDAVANALSINVASADGFGFMGSADNTSVSSLAQMFERMQTCYRPQVTGSDEVAGQPVYVVELGSTLCPSASSPEANGRETIWVDQKTFFVLKHELYSTEGDQLLLRSEATEVQYNPALDANLFTFTPPAGALVSDYRPQALPVASATQEAQANAPQSALLAALEPLAQQADFPLFAPATIPPGLAPRQPKLMPLSHALDQLWIELVPVAAVTQDVDAGQDGITIRQQTADYATLVSFTQGGTPVLLPGESATTTAQAWARRGFTDVYGTGADSGVIVLRDGVLITLNSFAYGPEELLAVAGSLQPAPGSKPALPAPQPPTLAEVRAAAPIGIFAPTWVPAGLAAEPPVGYSITYHDERGAPALTVTSGTGLADDPRYSGEPVTLANGLAAHWLGSSLLWLVQEGTPVALSSDTLTEEELLRVAASLSSSAELGAVELPPQPTPVAALPTPTPMPTPAFAALRPTWLPETMDMRQQVEGDTVSMGFTPAGSDSRAALVLVQTPATGQEAEITDPQASVEQIGGHDVTVIRRGTEGCVTYLWEANGLRLTLTNVYDPPGTLKYSCEQMQQIVAGVKSEP